jgi:hypothetical protein
METFVIRMAARHESSGHREHFRDARELLAILQTEHRQQSEEVDEQ